MVLGCWGFGVLGWIKDLVGKGGGIFWKIILAILIRGQLPWERTCLLNCLLSFLLSILNYIW